MYISGCSLRRANDDWVHRTSVFPLGATFQATNATRTSIDWITSRTDSERDSLSQNTLATGSPRFQKHSRPRPRPSNPSKLTLNCSSFGLSSSDQLGPLPHRNFLPNFRGRSVQMKRWVSDAHFATWVSSSQMMHLEDRFGTPTLMEWASPRRQPHSQSPKLSSKCLIDMTQSRLTAIPMTGEFSLYLSPSPVSERDVLSIDMLTLLMGENYVPPHELHKGPRIYAR